MESVAVNKADLAYAGAPLLVGEFCQYMFHPEFNSLISSCRDNEGMLVNHQIRVIQKPQKKCGVYKNIYILGFSVGEMANVYVKDLNGTYFCCDYFEPGFGYLFTDCGGKEVFLQKEKINSTMSQDLLSQNASMGLAQPLWNFTELQDLLKASC